MVKLAKNGYEYAILVENLCKNYGNFPALKNVSFSVRDGEIVGFLGPNGAGKTTTMNILTGCSSYVFGRVEILGFSVFEKPLMAKRNIGYLPENPPLYHNMTVFEYLKFVCDLKGVKKIKDEIKRVLELCNLNGKEKKLISGLSKGYKQRVGIAQALVGSPKVLILDEPTSGLDPVQIVQVRELIKSLSKSHTIILSTHILSEIQAVCDRIVMINGGVIVANDTEENLLRKEKNEYFLKVLCKSKEEFLRALAEFSKDLKFKDFDFSDGYLKCQVSSKKEFSNDLQLKISSALMNNKMPIVEFKPNSLTLEQVFIALIEKKRSTNVLEE